MKSCNLFGTGALGIALLLSTPALAQQQQSSRPQQQQGRTAESMAGEVGQRQSRTQMQERAGTEPMARINNRIPNRVQNRIRNRIDRNYDPKANTTSPFEVAAEQVEAAGSRRRR